MSPSIAFYHDFWGRGSYEKICLELGLQLRYDYNKLYKIKYNPQEILIDTREIKPYKLNFPIKTKFHKLI